MKRMDFLNYIIKQKKLNSYLEIGVKNGLCFSEIDISNKTGVDPNPLFQDTNVLRMTSDSFFNSIEINNKYDLIFIDGLHTEEQVDRDIKNSLIHLSDNGYIMLHDCSPTTEERTKKEYNGTTYKSIIKLRCNTDMNIVTIDADEGCAIINPFGGQELFRTIDEEDLLNNFSIFNEHRKEILNLISVDSFFEMYK